MKLVITEKPSVAMSIAKVIGAGERRDGWMEGGGYLVSWCIGHLVELSPPENYDEKDVHPVDTGRTSSAWRENATPLIASENSPSRILFAEQPPSGGCSRGRYGKWRYEDLPILPQDWRYQMSASTHKQFTVLKKLMERQDVTSLVCATVARRQWRLFGNDRSGAESRARGRADLSPCLPRERVSQAVRAALDLLHGGCGNTADVTVDTAPSATRSAPKRRLDLRRNRLRDFSSMRALRA